MQPDIHYNEQDTLWRVVTYGQDRFPVGGSYRFDNHQRQPLGTVVIQAVLEGKIHYQLQGQQTTVNAGQLFFYIFGEASTYGQPRALTSPLKNQWICATGQGLSQHIISLRRKYGLAMDYRTHPNLLTELQNLQTFAKPAQTFSQTDASIALYQFVMHLFEHGDQCIGNQLTPVQRAIDFAIKQPTRITSFKQLTRAYQCSREHFCRSFTQQVGQTPACFVRQAKLQRACQLLTQTTLALAAVAEQSGLGTVHTLNRLMQHHAQCTPKQFRQQLKPNATSHP